MPAPLRERLEMEDIGDVTVVNFVDTMLIADEAIQETGEHLFRLADTLHGRKVLLNFGHIQYLSSAFLGKLITFNKKVQTAGGKLILCNIAPQLYEVFEITKLDKFFHLRRPPSDEDPDAELGGVRCRLIPPKPTRGQSVAL